MDDTNPLASDACAVLGDFFRRSLEGDPFPTVEAFLGALQELLGEGVLIELHRAMTAKYGMPALGTSRVTYLSETVVFKVPFEPAGFRHNDTEASLVSTDFVAEENLARTRLHTLNGIPVLAMEKVRPATLEEIRAHAGEIPEWVRGIDTAQVGFAADGSLKAYDYEDLF